MSKRQGRFMQKEINQTVQMIMRKAKKDFRSCASITNNNMFEEITEMYDILIDQFYKYKTTSYIRHWEGVPGTMQGQALKFGKHFSKDNHGKKSPKLIIDFSGAGMEAEGVEYQYHTPDQVLNYVMNGARFVLLNMTLAQTMIVDPSTIVFHGKYFSYDGGTIRGAFDKFRTEWDSISRKAFYSLWGSYVKQWSK